MSVFTSDPVEHPHPLRAQTLRGGRSARSNPLFYVRDFIDVEKAVDWLTKRITTGQPTITTKPVVDYSLLVRVWQMYLNDLLGDCTCASFAHGVMVFAAMLGIELTITDVEIERMYEHSGWSPANSEATDQGWTLEAAGEFGRTIGLLGTAADPKPEIDAWAGVDVEDDQEEQVAMELFGGLSSGIECPQSALTQFQEGKPWTVVPHSQIAGGHAIWKVKGVLLPSGLIVAKGAFELASTYVTWGGLAPAEKAWDKEYVDEKIAFVPKDWETKLPEALLEVGIVDFSKLASLVGTYDSASA